MNGKDLKIQYRNEKGFFDEIDYQLTENGKINWRAMVDPKHLFPNKQYFERFDKEIPKSIEGLNDAQLLIKLAGIKELAQLRGYSSVTHEVVKCEVDHVAVKCRIQWIANAEDLHPIVFEDMANATIKNTSDFGTKFLETIAANRAFVRAVRNFLNIHVVGSDEIDSSNKKSEDTEEDGGTPTPHSILISLAKKGGSDSFEKFLNVLRKMYKENIYKNENTKNWKNWSDIPVKDARILISILNT